MSNKTFYFHLSYLPEGQSFSMLARGILDSENYDVPISSKYDPANFDLTTKEDFQKFYLLLPSRDREIDKVVIAFLNSDSQTAIGFLDYQLKKYTENSEDPRHFLNLIHELLIGPYRAKLPEGKHHIYLEWIEEKKIEFRNFTKPIQSSEKIKWLGSPAILAFLMQEFVAHGYIEPPSHGIEPSMSGLAKQCHQFFDIRTDKGTEVEMEYFQRAMRNPEALVNIKKQKFTIPDLSDLA